MKTLALQILCLSLLIPFAARAADTNPPPRLTVELRDGSRVVGTSAEKSFKFHTALFGEVKLDVKDIRAVDCVSSNSAKLTTAKGDTLTVSFADPKLAIKTGFGKVEFVVDLVRRLTVSASGASGAHHLGLVSLWCGEDNAMDSVGGNNGTLAEGATYGPGKVGRGFVFDGKNGGGVMLGSPASLQLQDFTIEAWVKRGDNSVVSFGTGGNGTIFSSGWGGYSFWMESRGGLYFNRLGDAAGQSGPRSITDTSFHHVAVTKVGSTTIFYLDGTAYPIPKYNTTFTFTTPIGIGFRPDNQDNSFLGTIDEVALYNHALSADEIRLDYELEN